MRRTVLPLVVLCFVAAVLFYTSSLSIQGQGQGNGGESEIQRGFQIAPVQLNFASKSRGLVGLGSYLVNGSMDCIGCHTANLYLPGGNPFNGDPTTQINTATYMGGGNPFGPFISRNLTPDSNGLPGGLTFAQFELAMRNGVDFKGIPPNPLLGVMPWPAYRHSTDHTLRAIYEYLSAIPCLEGGPGVPANRC